jgi:3,4-dihydroxy 2-butanone 4-phosphate synthase/GTP cyclohydrolase II
MAAGYQGRIMSDVKIQEAIAALAQGRPIVVTDNDTPQSGGDLVLAAERVTTQAMAFMIRNTGGVICAALTNERLDALRIPLMVSENAGTMKAAFTISVDGRKNTTTGISAAERAATIGTLIDPAAKPTDLVRPGHIFPLRAYDGGVLQRPGRTEASIDLAKAAGLYPGGVLAEVITDEGKVARRADLEVLAAEHDLVMVSIPDIIGYRHRHDRLIRKLSEARLPTRYGEFAIHAYESVIDRIQHVAMVMGDVAAAPDVLVRVHSECLTGDLFGSMRCDCGTQLNDALEKISAEGCGVLVYLRGHEGRGIGIGHKVSAYQLQDRGFDTLQANLELGLPADKRDYSVGAQILADLGITSLRLMTNNPAKYDGIAEYGLTINERVPLITEPNCENVKYLQTKQTKMGHLLGLTREPNSRCAPTTAHRSTVAKP